MRQGGDTRGLRLVACAEIARELDVAVAWVAGVQRGAVSVAQLRAAGLDDSAIARRVRAGRLHRILYGVYLVGHAEPAPLALETAALLACGPRALLSHETAGHLRGLVRAPDEIHVTTVGRRAKPRAGIRPHRTRLLEAPDRSCHEGLPATGAARTLVDLAATLTEERLDRAVAEAIATRQVTAEQVHRALDRATDPRGARVLRAVLDGGTDFLRSDGERALRRLIRAAGLPQPQFNQDIGRWNVDVVWRERRLIVELDGRDGHSSPWARDRDARKTAELEGAGWRVLRVTGRQLRQRPEWVLAQIAARLTAAA